MKSKYIDEIINDIKFLYENTPLDMNDFNFMIGFDYNSNGLLTPLTENNRSNFLIECIQNLIIQI